MGWISGFIRVRRSRNFLFSWSSDWRMRDGDALSAGCHCNEGVGSGCSFYLVERRGGRLYLLSASW